MRQALSSTVEGYDLLAPKFDHTPFRTPDPIIAATLAEVGLVDRALDLCCGTGAGLRALRPLCRERLVGVDFSPGMLAEARAASARFSGDAPVELVQADVRTLDLGETFDLVTCFGAFGHIRPREEAAFCRTIAAHLRPGGRFVFATAERPAWWRPGALIARGFNAVMHIRNALIRPPFVMFYLTFLLPDCLARCQEAGLETEVRRASLPDGALGSLEQAWLDRLRIVTAVKARSAG
ncbi:MAG: class I SAM-dependent methyltransferase [Polyangiaceae bacterium]